MDAAQSLEPGLRTAGLLELYQSVRGQTRALGAGLSDADATVQSMPDTSPAKWHLAHTTWFFEAMVLVPHLRGYRRFDPSFEFLFNSYYETIGPRHARPKRGMLTRPALETIYEYRRYVDGAAGRLLQSALEPQVRGLLELGCHHEQQHQELLLTDILHLFAQSPLCPAYREPEREPARSAAAVPLTYTYFGGGIASIGHSGKGFAFDCEGPRHRVFLEPYRLADRCITNREWLEFMADGGYREPLLWLSDGWAEVERQRWTMPLYWRQEAGTYRAMTLRGERPLEAEAPVAHLSYFEADAFARWKGKRLPTEAEWEAAAQQQECGGNFADSGLLRPAPAAPAGAAPRQMFGDVWEWTRSAFCAYPGFRPLAGAAGEYNGKFMSGQYVLRGGSCATPSDHIRATYRNFFRPDARWQFSGVRLAEDA